MSQNYENYSLYISKSSPLRSRIKKVIDEILISRLDQYDEDTLTKLIEMVASSKVYQEKQRQTTYAIVDHLLLKYLHTTHFAQLIPFLLEKFRNYIVIHELAALSWGDKEIQPHRIYDLISRSTISMKHQYHILNEMSVTYPEKTLRYISQNIASGLYDNEMREKILLKMIQDRQRTQPLAKKAEPVLSAEEIEQLDKNIARNTEQAR